MFSCVLAKVSPPRSISRPPPDSLQRRQRPAAPRCRATSQHHHCHCHVINFDRNTNFHPKQILVEDKNLIFHSKRLEFIQNFWDKDERILKFVHNLVTWSDQELWSQVSLDSPITSVKVTFFTRTAWITSNVYQSPKICFNARNRLRSVAPPHPLLAPDMVWDEWSSTVKCNTSTNSASIGHRSASWTALVVKNLYKCGCQVQTMSLIKPLSTSIS